MVKYPLWVQKLLYYSIQHDGGRHMANNCKTAFSLHVVESASKNYNF